jgi:hypothetical protein
MSVAAKLNQVMRAVTALSKDGKMQAQNYEYLSEEKVTTALHSAFADAGLVITPMAMQILSERENAKGAQFARIQVTYQLRDVDAPDEEPVIIQALGEGMDYGDKVLNKAMTGAYKYALRQACMISTGDDPDHTPSEQPAKADKPKAAPKNGNGNGAKPELTEEQKKLNAKFHAMAGEAFGTDKAGAAKYAECKTKLFGTNIPTPQLTEQQADQLAAKLGSIIDAKNQGVAA